MQTWGESADLIEFGIMHGLQFDTVERLAGREIIQFADDLERAVVGADDGVSQSVQINGPGGPGVARRSPITGLLNLNKMIHTTTWEIIHNGGKIRVFSHHLDTAMRSFPDRSVAELAREAAARTNAQMGGLNWRRMFGDANVKNVLQLGLLAPDWTTANLFTARDMFLNLVQPGGPAPGERFGLLLADVASPDVAAALARKYWLNVFFAGFVTTQLANFALNGHSTFENPGEGAVSKLTVFTGKFDEHNGQPINVHTAKQVLEPFQLVTDPVKFTTRKASSIVGLVGGVFMQRDRIGRRLTLPEDGTAAKVGKNAGFLLESITPIPLSESINLIRRGDKRDFRDVANAFTSPFDLRFTTEPLPKDTVVEPDPDEMPTTLPRRFLPRAETRIVQ
jgi:hypothetical protein